MENTARFTAIDIASEADTESLDRYGQNLDYYIGNDYSYIPMPEDEKYYDRNEGVLKDIEDEQWVEEDDSLDIVLEKLQECPFLLIRRYKGHYYNPPVEDSSDEHPDGSESNSDDIEAKPQDVEVEYEISSAEAVAEDFLSGESNEMLDDMISAKEYFKKHPELANEKLGSLYGIITLADLNRRTVKQIAYPTIAELADVLSQQIQSRFTDSEELYPQLKPATIGNWIQNRQDGLNVHIAEYMNLMEMKQIIVSSDDDFVEDCGFSSKTKCRDKLGSVNELRKKVMHANRTLVHDREDLEKTLKRIEVAQEIVRNIDE